MSNDYGIIKKAKGAYLHFLNDEKYLDLRFNSNIIGYSDKRLTTAVKNSISSNWNIKGNTIYHRRFLKLIDTIFGNEYELFFSFSLTELFFKLLNFFTRNNITFQIYGNGFSDWLRNNFFEYKIDNFKKIFHIFDMADLYLEKSGNSLLLKEVIDSFDCKILNYFWYPDIDIKTLSADIVILPELYSGNFEFVVLLVRRESIFSNLPFLAFNKLYEVPSLYLASALKNYYLIKRSNLLGLPKINWIDFVQVNRIVRYNKKEKYSDVVREFFKKKIILNENAPYYNYLPIIKDDRKILSFLRLDQK